MNSGQSTGSRSLAAGALVLALLAVPFFLFFYISIPLGATAVILALLSRGHGKISRRAKAAVIIGAGAICVSAASSAAMLITVYQSPQLQTQIKEIIDYYYSFYDEEENGSYLPPFQEDLPDDSSPVPDDMIVGGEKI